MSYVSLLNPTRYIIYFCINESPYRWVTREASPLNVGKKSQDVCFGTIVKELSFFPKIAYSSMILHR